MLFLAVTIAATLLALQGGGPHLYFLVLNHRYPTVTRLMHIAFPLSYMPLATGRISVAILILRIITRSKWRRRFLYLSIITTFVVNVVWCILWFVGCPPGTSLSGPYVAGHCWNASVMFGYSGFTASTLPQDLLYGCNTDDVPCNRLECVHGLRPRTPSSHYFLEIAAQP